MRRVLFFLRGIRGLRTLGAVGALRSSATVGESRGNHAETVQVFSGEALAGRTRKGEKGRRRVRRLGEPCRILSDVTDEEED